MRTHSAHCLVRTAANPSHSRHQAYYAKPCAPHRLLLLGCLRTLGTVLGTTLQTVGHASGIKRTANDVVTHTRKVFHTTAANQYDTVFLQIVTFTGDVGVHLLGVGQTYTGHLTHG